MFVFTCKLLLSVYALAFQPDVCVQAHFVGNVKTTKKDDEWKQYSETNQDAIHLLIGDHSQNFKLLLLWTWHGKEGLGESCGDQFTGRLVAGYETVWDADDETKFISDYLQKLNFDFQLLVEREGAVINSFRVHGKWSLQTSNGTFWALRWVRSRISVDGKQLGFFSPSLNLLNSTTENGSTEVGNWSRYLEPYQVRHPSPDRCNWSKGMGKIPYFRALWRKSSPYSVNWSPNNVNKFCHYLNDYFVE